MMKSITSNMKRSRAYLICLIMPIILLPIVSYTKLSYAGDLNGTIRLTGVKTESEDQDYQSLDQAYNIRYTRSFNEMFSARASLRYRNLGIDQSESANSYRYEFRPSGDIIWDNEYFIANGSVHHFKSGSNNSLTNLIRNGSGVNFSTKLISLPILTIRYEWSHIYNEENRIERDSRERRLQAGLGYRYNDHDFHYSFNRSSIENVSEGLNITGAQHYFKWNMNRLMLDDKLRVSTNYNFNYYAQTAEIYGTNANYEALDFVRALYLNDGSPEYDALDTANSLADRNFASPAFPLIDIGQGFINQNIGVDFGYNRDVSGLYIYTDRPSGSALGWQVYISEDNLNWNSISTGSVSFNPNFNRYEIFFNAQEARYIKAINFGINEPVTVYVTEIEALYEYPEIEERKRDQISHIIDLSTSYAFSNKWESRAEMSIQAAPKGEFANSRDQLYYTLSTTNRPNNQIMQTLKYQSGYDKFNASGSKNDNSSISYSVTYTPLAALRTLFTLGTRSNHLDGHKERENNSVILRAESDLTEYINLNAEAGYSRNSLMLTRRVFDTWTYRTGVNMAIRRSLDLTVNALYQNSEEVKISSVSERTQINLGSNYRMTRTIFIRATVTLDYNDGQRYTNQEYNLSWNLTGKISIGALAFFTEDNRGLESDRYNIRLNYIIKTGTSLSASFTNSRYSLIDRSDNSAIQVGLKTGF